MGVENGGLSMLPQSIQPLGIVFAGGGRCIFSLIRTEVKGGIRFFETGEMFHLILENLCIPFQVSGPSHHTTKLDLN